MQSWRAQFIALSAIWGSSFLCIKVLGEVWAPVHVALARVALGALFLVLVLTIRRAPLPRDRATWGHVAVVGALMNALPFTLFAFGEEHVSSVIAGLWNGTTPLMTLVAVLAFLPDERPDRRRLAGLAGGFAGLVVLLGPVARAGRRRAARAPRVRPGRRLLRARPHVYAPPPVGAPGGRTLAGHRAAAVRDGDARRGRARPPACRRSRSMPARSRACWSSACSEAAWRTS